MDRELADRVVETQIGNDRSIETQCEAFASELQSGSEPSIEKYVEGFEEPSLSQLIERLVELSIRHSLKGDVTATTETVDFTSYVQRFPDHESVVKRVCQRLMSFEDTTPSSIPATKNDRAVAKDDVIPTKIDRFEIISKLGSGGFGVVYRAHDPKLKREVAIKVARVRSERLKIDLPKLYEEASRLAQLDDSRLARVFEPGCTEDGMPFIVMQFYKGESLAERIKKGSISPDETAEIVADLAEALHVVHQHNLVHRDVKPDNVLMDDKQCPVLVDFGLALPDDEVGRGAQVVGTIPYMSPEQAGGKSHVLEPRSDIFSLGVMMYQMLAGKLPYRSTQAKSLMQEIADGEPSSVRQTKADVPPELDRICQKARERRPSDRYSTAQEMADELWAYLQPKQSVSKWIWAAAAACLIGGLAWFVRPQSPSPVVPPPPTASLKTPNIQFLRLTQDVDTSDNFFTDVVVDDMPLGEGAKIAIKVSLPAESAEEYLYLLHFPEGEQPELLWPVDLAKQSKSKSFRYPESKTGAIQLSGPRRRMLLAAGARSEPLDEKSLSELIKDLRFNYAEVLKETPLAEIADHIDPVRQRSRSRGLGTYVELGEASTEYTGVKDALNGYFPVFSGWVFEYGGEKDK